MGAFKKLLASDIIVTPFEVNKGFTFRGASEMTASDAGIDRFIGQNITGSFTTLEATTGQVATEYRRLVFNSIKELYYSNYQSLPTGDTASLGFTIPGLDSTGDVFTGPASSAGRYDNYLQTTLTQSREFPTGSNVNIGVVSIPSRLYGDKIQPGSFRLTNPVDLVSIKDDSEGNLVDQTSGLIIGQIFYSHGIAAITDNGTLGLDTYGTGIYGFTVYGSTDQTYINSLISSSAVTCSFSSSVTLYETQYKCTIDTSEFNFSLNPSLVSGSTDGTLYDFATGSYFNPYVTTVGLYNQAQDLIAVGKLSKPLPSNNTTDLTVLINLDR